MQFRAPICSSLKGHRTAFNLFSFKLGPSHIKQRTSPTTNPSLVMTLWVSRVTYAHIPFNHSLRSVLTNLLINSLLSGFPFLSSFFWGVGWGRVFYELFSHCCKQIPGKKLLMEGGCVLARGLSRHSLLCWGRQSGWGSLTAGSWGWVLIGW